MKHAYFIKMVDFKNLAWATSSATRASRKFIYLPYRASEKKLSYPVKVFLKRYTQAHTQVFLWPRTLWHYMNPAQCYVLLTHGCSQTPL